MRKLSGNFILFREWKFSLVTYNIEKGLPHTHKDVINFLSKNLVNSIDINEGIFLFIHENSYSAKREYPNLLELYRRWNFIKVNKVEILKSIMIPLD